MFSSLVRYAPRDLEFAFVPLKFGRQADIKVIKRKNIKRSVLKETQYTLVLEKLDLHLYS